MREADCTIIAKDLGWELSLTCSSKSNEKSTARAGWMGGQAQMRMVGIWSKR